jgi:glycosyltransferase involved in cell wall biosynthesis
MRIAFVGVRGVPDLYSGFETAVTEISARLVERGHEVIVYCRKGYGDESEPTYKGVKKIYLPRIQTKQLDTLSHSFLSLLHSAFHRVDVIMVFNAGNGPFLLIPTLLGAKYAVNVDGLEWERKKWGLLARIYYRFATWCCVRLAPEIIADALRIQDYYREHFKRETFFAAYGAYVESSNHPEILEEYGLKKDDYFFVASRLEPENNAALTVRAFEQVMTDKKLVIAGGANYRSAFIQELQKTKDPRIIFTGGIYKPGHIKELHCNCFAYIHGNEVGGTNPALLKALGYGNCVLYLDTGYRFNAEVVGAAGIPYPKDAEALRDKIQDLVDHPEEVLEYRKRAPERIKAAYTWDIVTDRYEELCHKLHEGR